LSRGIILTCVSTAASPDYFMFKVAQLKAQLELREIRPQCSFNIDQWVPSFIPLPFSVLVMCLHTVVLYILLFLGYKMI